jgi:hypothetical protein
LSFDWFKLPTIRRQLRYLHVGSLLVNLHAEIINAELLARDGAEASSWGFLVTGRFLGDDDAGKNVRVLEDLLGVSEIYDRLDS